MPIFRDPVAASRLAVAHLVTVLDGAGWHVSRGPVLPPEITLVVLPPRSPELDPVARVWVPLREQFLALRLLRATDTGEQPI